MATSLAEMVCDSSGIQREAAPSRFWSAMEWTAPTCYGSLCWILSVTASARIGGSSWPWSPGTIEGFTSLRLQLQLPAIQFELSVRMPMTSCSTWSWRNGMQFVVGLQECNVPWNMPDFTQKPLTVFFWWMDPMAILCTQLSNQCHSSSTCPWCPEFCPVPSTLYVSMFAQMPRSFRDSRLSGWNWLNWFHPPFSAWMASCWVLPASNTPWRPTPWISPAMGRSIATTWCEYYRPWTAIPQRTHCPSWRFRSWWFVVSWMPWHQPSASTRSLVWLPRSSWCPLQLGPTTVSLRLLNWPARRLWIFFRLIQRNWRIGEKRTGSPGPLDGIWSEPEPCSTACFPHSLGCRQLLEPSVEHLIPCIFGCIFKLCTAQNS